MPPSCWKYVNWVISIPSSQTSQPSPQAPRVVPSEVDAERLERAPVLVEDVVRGRLEDDLELVVVLEAERVLAVAPVRRADDGLDVGRPPLVRPEAAEEGPRIHRSGGDFRVVRLHDDAPALRPVRLERGQHVLVGWRRHGVRAS